MADESREIYDHPGVKKKSDVWKYFGFYKRNEEEPACKANLELSNDICKLCRRPYKNTGNTTNFRMHIESAHKLFNGENSKAAQTTHTTRNAAREKVQSRILFGPSAPSHLSSLSKQRGDNVDTAVYKLIVGKVLPPSLVENKLFTDLMKEMDPRYKVPSRKKLMSALVDKKVDMQVKVKEELRHCEGIGITHDGWTSANTESYNTTTVHYIDEEWQLKSAVLGTKKIDGSHTAEKIAETLNEVKQEWALPASVATTDNAANEVKAFQLLNWSIPVAKLDALWLLRPQI